MRNPDRIDEFCNMLAHYWKNYVPDWRFGQLICNVFGDLVARKCDPFFPEEDEMTTVIKHYFEKEGEEQ